MICPMCSCNQLTEKIYNADKHDITYECESCHFEFVVNITPDDEIAAHERERNLIAKM